MMTQEPGRCVTLQGTALRTSRRSPITLRPTRHIGSQQMGFFGGEAETKMGKRRTRGRRRVQGVFQTGGRCRPAQLLFFCLSDFFFVLASTRLCIPTGIGKTAHRACLSLSCGTCNSEGPRPFFLHPRFPPSYHYIILPRLFFHIRDGGSSLFRSPLYSSFKRGIRRGSSLYYYRGAKRGVRVMGTEVLRDGGRRISGCGRDTRVAGVAWVWCSPFHFWSFVFAGGFVYFYGAIPEGRFSKSFIGKGL